MATWRPCECPDDERDREDAARRRDAAAGFDVIETRDGALHVMPDAAQHLASRHCWCKPWRADGVWIHQDKDTS